MQEMLCILQVIVFPELGLHWGYIFRSEANASEQTSSEFRFISITYRSFLSESVQDRSLSQHHKKTEAKLSASVFRFWPTELSSAEPPSIGELDGEDAAGGDVAADCCTGEVKIRADADNAHRHGIVLGMMYVHIRLLRRGNAASDKNRENISFGNEAVICYQTDVHEV